MNEIDSLVRGEYERQHLPGVAVAVVQEGDTLYAHGYGVASLEHGTPATTKTAFCIGSLTKQFTATLIVKLIEAGKLRLDEAIWPYFSERIDNWVPGEYRAAWQQITVRHLLTHTSGLKRDPVMFRPTENTFPTDYIPVLYPWARQEFTSSDLLEQLAVLPLDFMHPGDKMSYSNAAYTLLGLLIESVTSMTYAEYLQQQILQPLGLASTRLVEDNIIPNFATGYTWIGGDDGTWRRGGYINPTRDAAAGSIVSTVEDLVRWDAAFYDDSFLSPDLRETMWTPALLNDGTPLPYGLGWAVGTASSDAGQYRVVSHSGMWGGFTSHWLRFPEERLTVIVLTNLGISGRVKDGGQRGDPTTISWLLAAQRIPGLTRA
jgi:D-alanyl-D-alanine carboxypeptidase